MLDINFQDPTHQVRLNIGDISENPWLSDQTITSALIANNNNVNSASIALFEALCTYFATQAEKEQEGQVRVEYTKLFERYRQRLEDFKSGDSVIVPTAKAFMPLIIGGVSRSQKKAIHSVEDNFSMYDMADWHNRHLGNNSLYQLLFDDLDYNIGR